MKDWIKTVLIPMVKICFVLFMILVGIVLFVLYYYEDGWYEPNTLDLDVKINGPALDITYNDTVPLKNINVLIADSIAYYHIANPKFPFKQTVQFYNTDIINDDGRSIDGVRSIKDIHIYAIGDETKDRLYFNRMFSLGGYTTR